MESRLKERLTGAAILVALTVLLVPQMFRGHHGEVATVGAGTEGPPVRSYTIDLSNTPTRTGPLQAADADGSASTGSDAASARDNAQAVPRPPAASAATTVAPPPPTPPPVSAPLPRAVSKGGWSVQLGLFGQRDNAERLMRAAQAKGFAASVAGPDAKGKYRVHKTDLPDRAAAQILAQRLKSQGFDATVAPPP